MQSLTVYFLKFNHIENSLIFLAYLEDLSVFNIFCL